MILFVIVFFLYIIICSVILTILMINNIENYGSWETGFAIIIVGLFLIIGGGLLLIWKVRPIFVNI